MNEMMAAKPGIFARASGWTLATIAFAVAVVVLLACYWETARSLVGIWAHDGTYQYAFLIFPVSVWAAWSLRDRVRANPPVPSAWGLVAIAVLVAIWYAGHVFAINLPQHFAFVAMFPALVLAAWGWRALWVLKFPLGYLIFAVPWGDAMVGPLQDLTANFAVHALNFTGVPVLLNGRELTTPSATWMVEQACSGVKFFIACTALGCLFAYLMYTRWWKRVAFVVLSALVPIIANGLRVYFTIMIGEKFGLHYATGTDHMIFGWQFFGTVLVVLMLVGWFFRDRLVLRKPLDTNPARPTAARTLAWPAALLLLLAGAVMAAGINAIESPDSLHVNAPTLAGWSAPQPAEGIWRPTFKGAAGQFRAAYRATVGGERVELFHAVYVGAPHRGHDLVTYGNNVYDPDSTQLLASGVHAVERGNGTRFSVRELRLVDQEGPRFIWYWYCVDARCSASPVLAKLRQAWAVLRGHAPRASVWAVSMAFVQHDEAKARADLRAFVQALPVTANAQENFKREQVAAGGAR
ncbi:MAG TPA: exosortase A [Rhodanobacteraceae bacterium]